MFHSQRKTIGHDIAKDLHDHGVGASLVPSLFPALVTGASSDVTMFQRSSTYVMSVKHGVTGVFGGCSKYSMRNTCLLKKIWNRFIL